MFENFIYLNLKEKYDSIFFWRTIKGHEVDFVFQENGLNLVEAKYKNLTKPQADNSLLKAIKSIKPKKVFIINRNLNKKITKDKQTIYFKNWNSIL